jgi:hypothetical protein
VNGPWNQINLLFIGFSKGNFPLIWELLLMTCVAFLFATFVLYNFENRRLHAFEAHRNLNEWLMWTSLGVFGLLLLFTCFSFDFLFVLPTMIGGAILFIWIRFIHFPPQIHAYEERLARQRYFAKAKAHAEAASKARPVSKPKRRRR